ncbi:hypothetical protein HU200_063028 [Digitaria exilis]|uniref:Uncharacterized protein n=1 Tax=Digitaria exilis TaxID=1010633 RepID=A0A835DZG6_9POAL|nr:hypothetical protein HU200_063028 [Digitaria exilis]
MDEALLPHGGGDSHGDQRHSHPTQPKSTTETISGDHPLPDPSAARVDLPPDSPLFSSGPVTYEIERGEAEDISGGQFPTQQPGGALAVPCAGHHCRAGVDDLPSPSSATLAPPAGPHDHPSPAATPTTVTSPAPHPFSKLSPAAPPFHPTAGCGKELRWADGSPTSASSSAVAPSYHDVLLRPSPPREPAPAPPPAPGSRSSVPAAVRRDAAAGQSSSTGSHSDSTALVTNDALVPATRHGGPRPLRATNIGAPTPN